MAKDCDGLYLTYKARLTSDLLSDRIWEKRFDFLVSSPQCATQLFIILVGIAGCDSGYPGEEGAHGGLPPEFLEPSERIRRLAIIFRQL